MIIMRNGRLTGIRHGEALKSSSNSSALAVDGPRPTTETGTKQLVRRKAVVSRFGLADAVGFAGLTRRAQDVVRVIAGIEPVVCEDLTYLDPETEAGNRLNRIYLALIGTDVLQDYLDREYNVTMSWSENAAECLASGIESLDGDVDAYRHVVVGMNGSCWLGGLGLVAVGGEGSPYAAAMKRSFWPLAGGWSVEYEDGKAGSVTLYL